MRVLIRQCNSSTFLADRKRWVPARTEALDFVSSVMALDVATRMDLDNIEIVLDFGDSRSEVILNVPDRSKNPPNTL
jgi:hypothetical protein